MSPSHLTMEKRVPGKWNALIAGVSSGVLILLALVAYQLVPGSRFDAQSLVARIEGVRALRIVSAQDVELNVARSNIRVVGADPFIVLEPPAAGFRISSVEMVIRPAIKLFPREFGGSFVPAQAASRGDVPVRIAVRVLEGLQPLAPGVTYSLDRQYWTLKWNLPEAARTWRIDLPPGADFRFDSVEVRAERTLLAEIASKPWLRIVGAAVPVMLLLLTWQSFGRTVVPEPRVIKAVLVLALMIPLLIVTFLLPPFQGPDENFHWKIGLMFYRTSITQEPAAYFLPEALETAAIPFHQDAKFQTAKLRVNEPPPGSDAQAMAASHRDLIRQVVYARLISYPVMFATSWLVPRVESIPDALQFYYLSRLIPAVLVVALLFALNWRYELPYTAWFFFSLPLVVQQSVVISADTLLNIGSVLAVLWFLKLREHYRWPLMVALCVLCISIAVSKQIAGAVLALPLLLVPYRRLPRLKLLLGLAIIVSVPMAYLLAVNAVEELRQYSVVLNRPGEVNQQLAFLQTPGGIKTFLLATARYARGALSFDAWAGPLGWVDTRLSPTHLSLIAASGWLAIVLDVWAYGPQVVRLARSRTREMAILISVAVGGLCFATVADAAIFYVMTSEVRSPFIASMMMKHLFPAAILAVLLPLAILESPEVDGTHWRVRPMTIANTIAIVLLSALFLARNIELAIELLKRYWA
jgi:hypothetical protein